eukprot:symbB.v1.2.011951.t1/scaffold813.1/size160256/7
MDPDYVLGKSHSTTKANVGIFAANGYKCYPPTRHRNRPRPADVKRLSMPVNRMKEHQIPFMPTLAKGRSASTPHLFKPQRLDERGERPSLPPKMSQELGAMKRASSMSRCR